tara:strand:- start:49 stop:519 length:471 start_codon:yes stop_codon:yes gene_type:complete
MKEINNYITHDQWNSICNTFLANNFPWFYEPTQVDGDSSFMMHCFYRDGQVNSDFYYLIQPILDKLKPTEILNIRANLALKRPMTSDWHVDDYWDKRLLHTTAIYYVNSCNGYTVFKNNKIKSVGNKILIFDANTLHKVEYQTDTDTRMVINFNYF